MSQLVCQVFLFLAAITSVAQCELYTAIADLEELMETEAVLLRAFEDYIAAQEHRLELLKKRAADYSKEHEEASRDVTAYLSNPINAYLLLKRLTTDWKATMELMNNDDLAQEATKNMTIIREKLKFPSDEDLTGAAVALMRLQDTYKLDTASLARGELNGVQYSTQLSAADCFELGRQSYNQQDFYHTVLWMTEALQRFDKERNNTILERWEILEYLAYSTYMQGNVHSALQMTDELLAIFPSHQRALKNRAYYEAAIEQNAIPLNTQYKDQTKMSVKDLPEHDLYEMLCRNAIQPPPEITAQLKCRYVHKNNPFLKLAPLKEEEAYLEPRIVLYREALYDSEIETVKKMAQPRLKRATVQNYKTGDLEVAHYRISKSAWLKEEEDPAVERISRRVEDMTGLTTKTAEELQVVNYGIGGHYEPHFDFARGNSRNETSTCGKQTRKGRTSVSSTSLIDKLLKRSKVSCGRKDTNMLLPWGKKLKREETNAFKSLGTGNRIATVLFYMSDVAQGGATVFPSLHLSLWPEKGTAAFWHNLQTNGEGDYLTRHAACPVLAGSKWVCNKWLHERGQEFLRPCLKDDVPLLDRS